MKEKQLEGEVLTHVPQMVLRDWFAGQALASMNYHDFSEFANDLYGDLIGQDGCTTTYLMAEHAYDIADEMLKAREANPLPTKPEGGKL